MTRPTNQMSLLVGWFCIHHAIVLRLVLLSSNFGSGVTRRVATKRVMQDIPQHRWASLGMKETRQEDAR